MLEQRRFLTGDGCVLLGQFQHWFDSQFLKLPHNTCIYRILKKKKKREKKKKKNYRNMGRIPSH